MFRNRTEIVLGTNNITTVTFNGVDKVTYPIYYFLPIIDYVYLSRRRLIDYYFKCSFVIVLDSRSVYGNYILYRYNLLNSQLN